MDQRFSGFRSVQLVGTSTFTVSLPKTWAERSKITPKSKLLVIETPDGSLIVSPPKLEKKVVRLSVEDDADMAAKMLVAAYLDGFDEVALSPTGYFSEDVRLAIRRAVRRLVGFEVVEEAPALIKVELAAEPKALVLETGLSRMSLLVKSALELSFGSATTISATTLSEIDEDADRLNFMFARRLRQGLSNPSTAASSDFNMISAHDSLMVFRFLERCVDHAVSAATVWGESKMAHNSRIPDGIAKIAYQVAGLLAESVSVYANKSTGGLLEVFRKRADLRQSILQLTTAEKRAKNLLVFYHIGRIVDYAGDIAELVLDEGYGLIK
jgi:phosphate uptake regulator